MKLTFSFTIVSTTTITFEMKDSSRILTAISLQADIESPEPSICLRAYSLSSDLLAKGIKL